jgi:hypothetical protein
MLDPNSLAAYSAHLARAYPQDMETTSDNGELSQRLGLYRVFLKIYDQHRELLDEILDLENGAIATSAHISHYFVQGWVRGDQAHLVTNLLCTTRALYQPQQVWIVGRDRRCGLALPDKRLSRRHGAIQYVQGQGFFLIDLGSTNGTYVNGELARKGVRLKEGDRVRMGNSVFTFSICHEDQSLDNLAPEVLDKINTLRLSLESSGPARSLEPYQPEETAAYQATYTSVAGF